MLHEISKMSVFDNIVTLQKETGNGRRSAEFVVCVKFPELNVCNEYSRDYDYIDACVNFKKVVEKLVSELTSIGTTAKVKKLGEVKNPE